MKTITATTIEYNELDKMVKEIFPLAKFEFVADEEMSNDSDRLFNNVTKEDFMNEFFPKPLDHKLSGDLDYRVTKNNLTEFLERISGKKNFQYHVYDMIMYLVFIEKLPEGNILVDVSW